MIDVVKARNDTPGVSQRIHFNNAGASLMPGPVIEAMQEYITFEAITGGYESAAARSAEIEEFYTACSKMIGAKPHNIAFVSSATDGYTRALSSIAFEPGDVILTSKNDYISNQIVFLSFARRFGVKIVRADDLHDGGVDPASVEKLIEQLKPKVVSVSHVPTNSGLVQDVVAVGDICLKHGILYMVDACQSVGQIPLDVLSMSCDFLSATFRKFLRGPRGAGFLYVSDRVLQMGLEPLLIDMRGARWIGQDKYVPVANARRFEEWEQNYALVMGAKACLTYAMNLGLEQIQTRVVALACDMREKLTDLPGVRVLDKGVDKCAITTSFVQGLTQEQLNKHLEGINVGYSLAEYAVIDFAEKEVPWALRASPHYFNTDQEIDEFIACVERAIQR